VSQVEEPQDQLIKEQIAYFEARAPEYDDSMEPDQSDSVYAEWQQLRNQVRSARLTGAVLDLAAGTGSWTELFIDSAETVTLVDASAGALEIARTRFQGRDVEFVTTDLFKWNPDRLYDTVFSSFWLCHIPPMLVSNFVSQIERACRSGGTNVLVDEHTFDDPGLAVAAARNDDAWVSHRTVQDGRDYRLVKVGHNPADVLDLFMKRGWDASLEHHGDHFYMIKATRF